MSKKMIDVSEYAGEIFNAVSKGVLLNTKADGKINTMTISWGALGFDWGVPVFTTYVRKSRFTHENLDRNSEFTVSIPFGKGADKVPAVCGSRSGRDIDKVKECGLTIEEPVNNSVPGFKEYPLTLECRVVYRQEQDMSQIPEKFMKFYSGTPDVHDEFYGEIVAAYIIE